VDLADFIPGKATPAALSSGRRIGDLICITDPDTVPTSVHDRRRRVAIMTRSRFFGAAARHQHGLIDADKLGRRSPLTPRAWCRSYYFGSWCADLEKARRRIDQPRSASHLGTQHRR
jgi:hypothetical protein